MEFHSEMQNAGRITIPVELRKKYNLRQGDIVTIVESDDSLKIITRQHALDEARALLQNANISSQDFLDWRRQEAQKEQKEYEQKEANS